MSYASKHHTHDISYLGFLKVSGHRGITGRNFEYMDIKTCKRNEKTGVITLGVILAVSKSKPFYNQSLIISGMPEDKSHKNLVYWVREQARESFLDWRLRYEDLVGLQPKGVKVYKETKGFPARLGKLSLKCGYKRPFGPHSARAGHTMQCILDEMNKPAGERMDFSALIQMLAIKQGWNDEGKKKAMKDYFKPAITLAVDHARLMGLGVQKYINEAVELADKERAELLRSEHGELVYKLHLYSQSLTPFSLTLST